MLDLAIKLAQDIPKFGNARFGGVLTYKKEIIAIATNHNIKSHPLAKKYGKNRFAIFPHCELMLIINALRRDFNNFENTTMYIARVVKTKGIFQPALAYPCNGCFQAIKDYGIKTVVFTI